jgi:chemotaxis protein histidine kinase CheA/CheY-like chemotaxis protein
MVLDQSNLDSINREVRNCFLYEDVPEYLAALEENIQLLLNEDFVDDNKSLTTAERGIVYKELMRITHSLKGGAGIAQLPHLSRLAHQLENSIEALEKEQICNLHLAHSLLLKGVESVNLLVVAALRGGDAEEAKQAESLTIFRDLESFLQEIIQSEDKNAELNALELEAGQCNVPTPNFFLLKTALEIDLEDCIQRVEQELQASSHARSLEKTLKPFIEECTLLGQVLKQDWLTDAVESLDSLLGADVQSLTEIVEATITYLRQQRSQILNPQQTSSEKDFFGRSQEEDDDRVLVSCKLDEIQITQLNTALFTKKRNESQVPSETSQGTNKLKFKMSVSRLNRINNTFGELLIDYERLSLQQRQLAAIERNLKKRVEQFTPIEEQVEKLYDRLATDRGTVSSAKSDRFDVLELDRYCDFHSSLQNLQDLMGQIKESRIDLDFLSRELQDALDEVRLKLYNLRGDLTDSRFVPFRMLTEQFSVSLPSLNQQYYKSVELKVEGEEVPIDRVMLEQLQTPLTHLFRNAFDHGIETLDERIKFNKSPAANITLSAKSEGNRTIIEIADDGRGIDLNKVYCKAREKGLCDVNIDRLTPQQILEFLFESGFSTADRVTQLSGRGVGLDVVRLAIERLRGTLEVETSLGVGTKFIIGVPLSLSILPLLLFRSEQRTLAIPSQKVLEIVSIADLAETEEIYWRDRLIPLYSLSKLLPYTESYCLQTLPPLALVLDVAGVPIAVSIDELLEERELVVKPFDNTVKVPAYAMGCAVLGTGEVILAIAPDRLSLLFDPNALLVQSQQTLTHLPVKRSSISILIVDDSIAVRRMLDACLRNSGFSVTQCKDGRDALSTLDRTEHDFDLVISDIEMPNLDGFGLLKEIRSHLRWKNLPVAMLTSRNNQLHRQQAISLGANAYFNKPFQPNEFLQAIGELLSLDYSSESRG